MLKVFQRTQRRESGWAGRRGRGGRAAAGTVQLYYNKADNTAAIKAEEFVIWRTGLRSGGGHRLVLSTTTIFTIAFLGDEEDDAEQTPSSSLREPLRLGEGR